MATAGTVRFPAPAARFEVGRSGALAWTLATLNGIALANLAAWLYWSAPPAPTTVALALLAWLMAALLSVRAYLRLPVGRLNWDTEAWSFEYYENLNVQVRLGMAAEAAMDLQVCMLLHFPKGTRSHWVFVTRRHDPSHWLALRRAVYSPAIAVQRPPRDEAFGNTPAA